MDEHFWKRDVQLTINAVRAAKAAVDNLQKIRSDRSLSLATTKLDEAELWLREIHDRTPEN